MTLTIGEVLGLASDRGLDKRDAEVLLCHLLDKARTFVMAFPETILSESQAQDFDVLLNRRAGGEPVAYIIGEREFWSLPIKTSPATLIPRPDTEVLVETVLNTCSEQGLSVVDLGTGTGAIALALKSERRLWQVSGVDRIAEAVSLARENARRLSLEVEFEVSSWCDAIEPHSVDVIVTNPPYIDANDLHLNEGDVRFEPASALIAEEQGLADIKTIAHQALRCLRPNGYLFIEHGWQQGEAVQSILTRVGFSNIQTVQDYAGHDRVTFGSR